MVEWGLGWWSEGWDGGVRVGMVRWGSGYWDGKVGDWDCKIASPIKLTVTI